VIIMAHVARLGVSLVNAQAAVRSDCREGRVRSQRASISGARTLSIAGPRRAGVVGRVAKLQVVAGPQIEPDTDGSALDFPQEWMKPGPSRRPDIFPDFQPMKPALPQPMPGDPEEPEEMEEEEGGDPDDPDQEPPPEEAD